MTIRKYFAKYLYDHGMFEIDAAKCLDFAEKQEVMAPIADRWDDDIEGYPPQLLAVLRLSMRQIALQWIDEEHEFERDMKLKSADIPPPWYRAMFTDEPTNEINA